MNTWLSTRLIGFGVLLVSAAGLVQAQVKPSKSVPFPLQKYVSEINTPGIQRKMTVADSLHSLIAKIVNRTTADTTWWLDKIEEQYFSGGTLADGYRTYYAYNDQGNTFIMLMKQYNSTSQTWENYEKADLAYNSVNLISDFIILSWDSSLQDWQKNTKIHRSYSSAEKITEELYSIWDGTDWINDERISITYDSLSRMSSVTYQYWQAESYSWINYYQLLIGYNADGTEYYEVYQVWFLGEWYPMEQYVEYKHNSFGRVDSTFSQYSNGYYWVNSDFAAYEYEQDTLLRKIEYENWNDVTGWILTSRDLYSYTTDASPSDTAMISEILTQNWSGSWSDSYHWLYTYDGNQNILQEIYETKDTGSWLRVYIEEYHYTLTRPTEVPTPIEKLVSLPRQTKLYQNYPNPFNPSTIIEYELNRPLDVKLEVFDIAGRLVRTLVFTKQPIGRHSVSFNANGLASGVYFYRLQAGESIQVRKMVLVR